LCVSGAHEAREESRGQDFLIHEIFRLIPNITSLATRPNTEKPAGCDTQKGARRVRVRTLTKNSPIISADASV
jgi:hypothetical protein